MGKKLQPNVVTEKPGNLSNNKTNVKDIYFPEFQQSNNIKNPVFIWSNDLRKIQFYIHLRESARYAILCRISSQDLPFFPVSFTMIIRNFIKELRLNCDSTCDTGISQVKSRDAEVTSSSLLFDRRVMLRQGERE